MLNISPNETFPRPVALLILYKIVRSVDVRFFLCLRLACFYLQKIRNLRHFFLLKINIYRTEFVTLSQQEEFAEK
jgi:hypothetical protein